VTVGQELVFDYRTLSLLIVAAFALIGFLQGGARTILVVGACLAVTVALGEPAIAAALLRWGEKALNVLRRAVGAGPATAGEQPGPYFFAVYLVALVAVALLCKAILREQSISRSSRAFGAVLGVLNGLLFALVLREHLLPVLEQSASGGVDIHVKLQADAARSLVGGGGLSVGTVGYVFGLLLAGAGVFRKLRSLRGPGI
jgi:hypothetical protein